MEIIISTRNPSKAGQIKEVFLNFPAPVYTLEEYGIEGEGNEDGVTLEENALKKALFAFDKLHDMPRKKTNDSWAIADDTGFYITALEGAPGVHAARWAGKVSTEEITKHTLKKLENASDRSAHFRTVVCLISPAGEQYYFDGLCHGTILEAARTEPQPMMPYSPIFVADNQPEGKTLVWAEMETADENAISHRGIAFRKAYDFLLEN